MKSSNTSTETDKMKTTTTRHPIGFGVLAVLITLSFGAQPAQAGLISSILLDQIIDLVDNGADSDGSQSVTEDEATSAFTILATAIKKLAARKWSAMTRWETA